MPIATQPLRGEEDFDIDWRLTTFMEQTQYNLAKSGQITPLMEQVAQAEGVSPEVIRRGIAEGQIIIAGRTRRKPTGIGRGLGIKVNANLGTSPVQADPDLELQKLQVAEAAGADAVMDLSIGGDITRMRRLVLEASTIPVGTVPIYQAVAETIARGGQPDSLDPEHLFEVMEAQAQEGVDFVTVHCGLTQRALQLAKTTGRILPIVSRGGTLMARWMSRHGRENPLYEQYDRLLAIARKYDLILSLGDGLRPGTVVDATDQPQLQELIVLGELTRRAWEAGVSVMVEGPGHVPLDQIQANILLEKRLCHGAPFYVLGPLVTDCAPGYDHITSAIGAAIAGAAGADFICYVTPAEHLRLPNLEDVRLGVIAARIAAHAAELARGYPQAIARNREMSTARRDLDWKRQAEFAIDPKQIEDLCSSGMLSHSGQVCSMCGEFCAIKLSQQI